MAYDLLIEKELNTEKSHYVVGQHSDPECDLFVYHTRTSAYANVLYLHGGGFLFGEAEDLPENALDMFGSQGIKLFALNYPLAPANSLDEIVCILSKNVQSLCQYFNIQELFLFGRSAGAYLAYQLAETLKGSGITILGLISFYGFYDLKDPYFLKPSARYSSLKQVDASLLKLAHTEQHMSSATLVERYPLYVYARQTGCWIDLLGKLPERDVNLDELPPLFLAASANDEDIPYSYSKKLWRKLPGTVLKTYYNVPHEVDSFASPKEIAELYQELVLWIQKLAQKS